VHVARDGEVFPVGRPVPSGRRLLCAGIFLYLLHEPVIVAAAWIIARWHAPIGVKYPALVAVSFTATFAIYELAVRRYRITRFLFCRKPVSLRWDNDQSRQAPAEIQRQLVGRS